MIQGRNDVITPSSAAVDYFKEVKALTKDLMPISGGHFGFMTHDKQSPDTLVQRVRPVATSRVLDVLLHSEFSGLSRQFRPRKGMHFAFPQRARCGGGTVAALYFLYRDK